MILSLKGLQVLCSHNLQVLKICLSIVQISKTIVKFFWKISFWNNSFCDPLKYFLFDF